MRALIITLAVVLAATGSPGRAADNFELRLRHQTETHTGSGRFHQLQRDESWQPQNTAIIVCDMWDSHHCFRAVLREKEFAPRLNTMLMQARQMGATIIHAPSACMQAYVDHPARRRAIETAAAANHPDQISDWCYKIPAEEAGTYPIDQSDGGEDDTPTEHAAWEAELKKQGRNPKAPWLKQIAEIEIDANRDYISDSGTEIWNVLEAKGIENVMIAGVHTNMCVLGRPFGLRRLAMAKKNVVLVRDLTDTMYNPASWPYVSHFSGTDLVVSHIEKYVCPTITSEQIIGDQKQFRFQDDHRAHVAIVISEPEYGTERTLPLYVTEHLIQDHRITMVFGNDSDENELPGIELISEADALLLSVRRRTPPVKQLQVVRDFVASGKPVLGIRTANHAFALRKGEAPEGSDQWPELDAHVFGGSYTNHYGKDLPALINRTTNPTRHPILEGIPADPFVAGGSLYMVSPVAQDATVLLTGKVEGHPSEPVAWTFQRADGAKSFYTSLGTPADFEHPAFQRLIRNAIAWATESKP